jgi:transcriptional regulator with XRE-family HTH domain
MPTAATARSSKILESKDLKSGPEMRGQRLKSLRMMTGLSRKKLEQDYHISASTIQSWEDAKAGGLTKKGAERVIAVFIDQGIRCSVDWLLYGIGTPPQLSNKLFDQGSERHDPIEVPTEDRAIVNELLVFRQNNPDAVEYIIIDDGMAPNFATGDYVAGKRRSSLHLDSCIGKNCIVETRDNEILFRRVKAGSKPGTYTLTCINSDTSVRDITLYDRELITAAPVIWHRKKDFS